MAAVQKGLVVAVFAVSVMTMTVQTANGQVNCNNVMSNLAPCLGFLQTPGTGKPTATCCNGVKNLSGMAKTSPLKRQVCNCLKPQISSFPRVTDAAVAGLPGKCNVVLGFSISKNTNCNTL